MYLELNLFSFQGVRKMKELYSQITKLTNKRKNVLLTALIIFIAFEAIWIFPLKYEVSLLNGSLIIAYVFVGIFIGLIQKLNDFIVILTVPVANIIGLGLRIIIEWGEVTVTEELTLFSVLITYIPVIVFIFIGYFYTRHYLKKVY